MNPKLRHRLRAIYHCSNRAILLLGFLSTCQILSAQAPERPNVLLIVCDDLNSHLTPSGYKPIETPSLDKLATESMTFHRAYCQYPVCGPSRASMLSGLYPESTGVLDNKTDIRESLPNRVSLPQTFKRNGYWTASTGKVFHSPRHQPGAAAWDQQIRFQNEELPIVTAAREQFEKEHGSVELRGNRRKWKALVATLSTQTRGQTPPGFGPSGLRDDQHKDGKNARQVVQWIQNQTFGTKPFFIACGIQKPHVPFLAPQKYFDQYPTHLLPKDETPDDDWQDIPPMALVKRFTAFGFEAQTRNEPLRRNYIQAYHACISFIDAQIGLVLDTLRSSPYWQNTIILFTSDHGYHLGEHFLWGKVSLFEESARTPLMVRAPGFTIPGSSSSSLVEQVDFFPTLLDLCNIRPEQSLQGTSFKELLRTPSKQGKERAYTGVSRGKHLGRSIRTARWRYALWDSPDNEELYDLASDPGEFQNLAGKSSHATVLEQMRSHLASARKQAMSER